MPKQAADEVSTQDVVGVAVYDADDTKIGHVNDLIMDSSGTVQAAVNGVGGFLGIGEKDVAVKFSEIQSRQEANGEIRVTLNVTKEQLQAAPEYAYTRDRGPTHRQRMPCRRIAKCPPRQLPKLRSEGAANLRHLMRMKAAAA